jgi:hypothetical protein
VKRATLHAARSSELSPKRDHVARFDRAGTLLLFVLGSVTFGIGIYFYFFRPAMLPEDARRTGMDPRLLEPALAEWLRIVFRTWGAFLLAFSIIMLSVASYMRTLRSALLSWGVVLAVLLGFGQFLISNLVIQSDYVWLVAALFAVALLAAVRITLHARQTRQR